MKTKPPTKLTEAEIRAELEALGLTEWPIDQPRDPWPTFTAWSRPSVKLAAPGWKWTPTHYAILPGGYWSVGPVR